MTTTWTNLAQQHGAKAAVSLTMSDEELEAMTAHQSALLIDALRPLLRGEEQRALDYGCGAARLTPMLHDLLVHPEPLIWGYDPCPEMLHLSKQDPERPLVLTTGLPNHKFDVVFMAQVLGDPECKVGAVIHEALSLLKPGGLLIATDHMPDYPPPGRWWRFRSQSFYQGLFKSYDIRMDFITKMPQGENEVTVLAGRKKGA
jgi:SAM-dependent methyltransferase